MIRIVASLVTLMAVILPACADAQSCRADIGARRAQTLVDRCIEISPATHPPCNASNPCSLIRDEIQRGCSLADDDKPGWCTEYSGKP